MGQRTPGGSGIWDFDNDQNPLKDYNAVYIPYCTGDIHWGANDAVYPDTLGVYGGIPQTIRHRGFVNFQVVLKWIRDNFENPEKIFVSGSSAGSYGAIMGFPYIKESFPRSKVYVLGDAGNGAQVARSNVNFAANTSPRGLAESCGLMVNYVYSQKALGPIGRAVRSLLPWGRRAPHNR